MGAQKGTKGSQQVRSTFIPNSKRRFPFKQVRIKYTFHSKLVHMGGVAKGAMVFGGSKWTATKIISAICQILNAAGPA